MLDISEGVDPEDAVHDFVDNNQELVSEWTGGAEEMASAESSSK